MKSFDGKIDKFILLDHMDWLSTPKEAPILQEQWQYIIDKAASGGKILFRSGGINVDWMKHISISCQATKTPLFESLRFNSELSHALHALDRVHTYGSFYVADVIGR